MASSSISKHHREILEQFLMDIEILDKLDTKLAPFNIFETLGIIHKEIRHSNILSWLMAPNENHGLGDYVIKKVVQSIVYQNHINSLEFTYTPLDISMLDYNDFVVRREWRNIDILAVSYENKFVVAIENKIWSKESAHQLSKYRSIIQEEFPEYQKLFVFLTPDGEAASDEINWQSFDYDQFTKIIETGMITKGETMSQQVGILINQYIATVRRYIVGDEELERVCREIYYKHKKALDLIFEYKPDIYSDIAEDLKEFITQQPELILDISPKKFIRFSTKKLDSLVEKKASGWTSSKRLLLFEFQNINNKLVLKLIIGPGEPSLRERIYSITENNKDTFKGHPGKNNNKYSTVYTREFLPKNFEEEFDYEDISKKISNEFNHFLNNDLKNIHQAFNINSDELKY